MSSTYLVTVANTNSGEVHGHKAGCADLRRGRAYSRHQDEQFEIEVSSKREAWLEYNSDFIAEGGEDSAWPIEWLPCADHVPAEEEPVEPTETVEQPEPTAPKKVTKKDLIDALVERGTHHRPALQKMTLAALEALVAEPPKPAAVEQPAAVEPEAEVPAAPAKGKRQKNVTIEVDGYRVRISAWVEMHDAEGKRIAIVRREAVPLLAQAVTEKVLRVQTAYMVDEKSIGWVRNGASLAFVAKVLKKALREAGK